MSATATVLVSIALGIAALVTSIFTVVTQIRDRGRSVRKQESDIASLQGKIELDETTRDRLAAEAAQINADQRIATEKWWKEQFDAVKDELVEEQAARRTASKTIAHLTKWATEHQSWDQSAWKQAQKTDPDFPAPPKLETD